MANKRFLIKPRRPVIQRGHPLAKDLVLALPFMEGSGKSVIRDIAKGNTAAITDTTPINWITTPYGPGVRFPNVDGDYIKVAPSKDYVQLGSASVSILYKPSTSVTGCLFVAELTSGENEVDNSVFWLWSGSIADNTLEYIHEYGNGSNAKNDFTNVLVANTWSHIVVSRDANDKTVKLWFNGIEQVATQFNYTNAPTSTATSIPIWIGSRYNGSTAIGGDLVDVRYWGRALTDTEAQDLYHDPWALYRPPNIVKLGESKITVPVDHTTNSLKRIEDTVNHTTDTLKRTENVLDHSTDAYLSKFFLTPHTTDTALTFTSTPILVSPDDATGESSPVTFVWEIPFNTSNKNMYCHIEIDDTDENFNSIEASKTTYADSGFEYWDGGSWEAYPANGVGSSFYGNEARIPITLTSGTRYWRVRGGVK